MNQKKEDKKVHVLLLIPLGRKLARDLKEGEYFNPVGEIKPPLRCEGPSATLPKRTNRLAIVANDVHFYLNPGQIIEIFRLRQPWDEISTWKRYEIPREAENMDAYKNNL